MEALQGAGGATLMVLIRDGQGPGPVSQYILESSAKDLTSVSNAAAAKLPQSCPTVQPHRWQPTRLPHPWDSPGKNTGVGAISFSNA